MRKSLLILICLFPWFTNLKAEPDDFGIWSYFQIKYDFSKNIYGATHFEHRSKDNTQHLDCFIARQYLGYRWNNWLKTDIAYDFIKGRGNIHNRYLFSVTGTLNEGNFTASLRERYLFDYANNYSEGESSSNSVLRSKATFSYHIPKTCISPYLAYEMFTWDKWNKTRNYAGAIIKLDKHSSLDLFYMYYTKTQKAHQDHLLGLSYILSL